MERTVRPAHMRRAPTSSLLTYSNRFFPVETMHHVHALIPFPYNHALLLLVNDRCAYPLAFINASWVLSTIHGFSSGDCCQCASDISSAWSGVVETRGGTIP